MVTAGVFGIFGFVLGGHVSDIVGRKPMVALANVLAFPLRVGFLRGRGGRGCFATVTLAYVTELFPTELRATVSSVLAGQGARYDEYSQYAGRP